MASETHPEISAEPVRRLTRLRTRIAVAIRRCVSVLRHPGEAFKDFCVAYYDFTTRHKQFFEVNLPLWCVFVVAVHYETVILTNSSRDTTAITNGAFAIVASLGALSFSASRAIPEEADRDQILFAGERFFHAAMLLIVASVLKYATLVIRERTDFDDIPWSSFLLSAFGTGLVGGLFFRAVLTTHIGLRFALRTLFLRRERRSDWEG